MPREFCRQPISLFEFRKWKATELRQLLLYSEAVVLHNVLPHHIYQNFLTISIAMILLLCPRYAVCEHTAYLGHNKILLCPRYAVS